eukprot:2304179-Pyramimonas_sp.AAC.1
MACKPPPPDPACPETHCMNMASPPPHMSRLVSSTASARQRGASRATARRPQLLRYALFTNCHQWFARSCSSPGSDTRRAMGRANLVGLAEQRAAPRRSGTRP